MKSKKLHILAATLFLSGIANAQFITDERVISFENGTSTENVSASKGNFSLSGEHYKDGKSSLKWNYRGKEDYLSIKKDLKFELKDPTGTDLYLSTFVSWVYNENPVEGTIRFEFLKDGKSCCSFPMNINFKGWRAAWVCYERDMEGTPEEGMNEIRIHAPEGSGSLFFDLMMTAAKTDHRHQTADVQLPFVNEGNHNHWLVVYKNSLIQPNLALTPLTETERKEIKILEQRFKDIIYTKSVLSENTFSKLKEQFEYYQIRYDENGKISGMPLFFGRAAEAYERLMDNWSKEMFSKMGNELRSYFDLMRNIAYAYHNAQDNNQKEELEQMFLAMYDHVTDQGVSYGSGLGNITHYGYSFRSCYLAYFLMKEPLDKAGKLNEAERTMQWYAITNEVFSPITINGIDIDSFNTQTTGRIASILMMADSPEKVRYLRAFSKWLDNGALPAPGLRGSFKTDGSCFHHCNNYPAYAVGGLNGATDMIYLLSRTSFAVSEEAHQTVKNVLMAMRFYCNDRYFPLSMSGRHPDGLGRLVPLHFATLSLAGSPDGKDAIDKDLAQAYLRFVLDNTSSKETPEYVPVVNIQREKNLLKTIQTAGFMPEDNPNGNLSLGYSCVNVHRRGNWSLTARGHSRYLWAAEHYLGCNLFGRYLAHGSLQLMTSANEGKVSPTTSRWQEAGFDWARIPGTTAIYMPVRELHANILNVDAHSGVEEMLYSDQYFAGSLSQNGENGNFGMKLREHDKYNGSHRARKSYHFFDKVVVALGTSIENDNDEYSTETTIFQTLIPNEKEADFWNNNKEIKNNWLLDPVNTGYYFPKKEMKNISLHVNMNQQSLNEETALPTSGDWASMVFNHGKAPKNGSYEYALLPDCDAETLKKFAAKPSYKVLQQDDNAHIVKDLKSNSVSYVIFEGKTKLPSGHIAQTDTACLLMTKDHNDGIILTVANPDLALYRGESDELFCENGKRVERSIYSRPWIQNDCLEVPVVVTLKGKWNIEPTGEYEIISSNKKETQLRVRCREAKSYDIKLTK